MSLTGEHRIERRREDYRNDQHGGENELCEIATRAGAPCGIDQDEKVMILGPESTQGTVPGVPSFIPLSVGLNVTYDCRNLLFKRRLIVLAVELVIYCWHVGQSPRGFGEVQHLSLDVRQRNAIVLCLRNYACDEVFLRLTNRQYWLHGSIVFLSGAGHRRE